MTATRKILLFYAPATCIVLAGVFWLGFGQNYRVKLLIKLFKQPLEQIRADYAGQNCRHFSQTEINQGYFEAFVTGYCRPRADHYQARQDFLCAVGLNCSCPSGRRKDNNCLAAGPLAWASCNDFDDKKIAYCDLTASQAKPGPGQVAADWSCFPAGATVNINNHDYLVTDKGSAITGRRFDIWFADCDQAFRATGIYKVKIRNK